MCVGAHLQLSAIVKKQKTTSKPEIIALRATARSLPKRQFGVFGIFRLCFLESGNGETVTITSEH